MKCLSSQLSSQGVAGVKGSRKPFTTWFIKLLLLDISWDQAEFKGKFVYCLPFNLLHQQRTNQVSFHLWLHFLVFTLSSAAPIFLGILEKRIPQTDFLLLILPRKNPLCYTERWEAAREKNDKFKLKDFRRDKYLFSRCQMLWMETSTFWYWVESFNQTESIEMLEREIDRRDKEAGSIRL